MVGLKSESSRNEAVTLSISRFMEVNGAHFLRSICEEDTDRQTDGRQRVKGQALMSFSFFVLSEGHLKTPIRDRSYGVQAWPHT